jgi:hypothetical protein
MAYNGVNIDATFFPAGDASTDKLELAAYRIDQLLGFDLVPTTVSRVINGQPGTLQLAYPNFLTESQRLRQSTPDSNWCPLPQQLDLLALFDYLIGQGERSKSSFGYTQPLWDLKASSHDEAFEAFLRMPEALAEYARQLPLNLRAALASLNQTTLSQTLGQQLDEKQIANLLARRNALLAILPDQEASYDQSGTAAMDDTRR